MQKITRDQLIDKASELLSNGTDNNKDARWQNAEGKDKREELKKDFFECGEVEAFAQSKSNNEPKISAEDAFDDAVIIASEVSEDPAKYWAK